MINLNKRISVPIAITIVIVLAVLLVGGVLFYQLYIVKEPSNGSLKTISDEELLEYAKSSFNKEKMMFKDIMIGYHNGIPVRVTFPCSDVCPNYTIRVIRYDVELDKCEGVGGVAKAIYVPFGVAMAPEGFCFPKIIVSNKIYDFAEDWTLLVRELQKIADKINFCNEKSDCVYKEFNNCHIPLIAFNKDADLTEFNKKFTEYEPKLPPCDYKLRLDSLTCEANKCISTYFFQE